MPVVVGPIAGRQAEIVGRVAELLHVAPDDVWVTAAVDSATEYAVVMTNLEDVGLPDEPLVVAGLIVFAQRMYTDSPSGVNVAIGDPSFEPIFQPENLWKHVRHYFIHLRPKFAIG
jgi:hypothetical protein